MFTSARIHLAHLALGLALFVLPGWAPAAQASPGQGEPSATAPADSGSVTAAAVRELVIERIEVEGNTRTAAAIIEAVAGITAGDQATSDAILSATDRLRRSQLVRAVDVHTRQGSAPGRVVIVWTVQERRPQLRLGLGFQNLAGWYLIPVQLNLDNITGHSERFDLSLRFGFRVVGLVGRYRRPSLQDSRHFWEVAARVEGLTRLYYVTDTQVRQEVDRGGLDLRLGRPLSRRWAVEGWLSQETVNADSTAEVDSDRPILGLEKGREIPYEDLPPGIQKDVGQRPQTRFGLSLGLDTRRGRSFATRGLWGRTLGEVVLSREGSFVGWQWDLRGYAPLGRGLMVAARTRAAIVSREAPFYERFYLGGLYTVRGYPDQSLSPPGGNLRAATASVELRSLWIGPPRDPRLVGFLFLDMGVGWDDGGPDLDQGAASIGYGLNVGLPWIDRLGVNVGIPLSPSPVNEAFRIDLAIGWTY